MRTKRTKSEEGVPDSEDRMRELVALTQRIELRLPQHPETVVAGFRQNGFLSLYFGEDPFYQFDERGRLRRANIGGRLFRTQGTGLAALTRERSPSGMVLVRHDLSPAEFEEFLAQMVKRVIALRSALSNAGLDVVSQVPEGAPIAERLLLGLDTVLNAAGELAPAMNRMR
jgi:hypothetical protein